jgi:Zn-finger domain-containing protein
MTPVKNNMTLGIILTVLGVSLTILGIVLLAKNSDKIVEAIETTQKEIEVERTEKQKGDDFEKYIVQKFSKSYFSIVEWTGDKYIDGMYPISNTNPDLRLRFKMKEIEKDFAVECKYRSDYYKNGVEWCSEQQLQNYKTFATDNEIAVFVAIGIGGVATAPEELFIIPLTEMTTNFVNKSFLNKYKKEKIKDSNLFYDYQSGRLK